MSELISGCFCVCQYQNRLLKRWILSRGNIFQWFNWKGWGVKWAPVWLIPISSPPPAVLTNSPRCVICEILQWASCVWIRWSSAGWGTIVVHLIHETRWVKMFGGNHILVKTQMAPRRSAEPGNPEWKRGAWRIRGILLPDRPGLWEKRAAFWQTCFKRFKFSLDGEMNETFSFVPNLSERVSGENECSQIVLNFLTRLELKRTW